MISRDILNNYHNLAISWLEDYKNADILTNRLVFQHTSLHNNNDKNTIPKD